MFFKEKFKRNTMKKMIVIDNQKFESTDQVQTLTFKNTDLPSFRAKVYENV